MRLPDLAHESRFGAAAEDISDGEKPRIRSQGGGGGGSRRVAPTTVADAVDGVVPPGSGAVEKIMVNGDVYRGEFAVNVPHGVGKYLWMDGCMYEGGWRRGKAAGKGKFSWPSGATYEGEFRSGRMEGLGTFTGPDGGTYRGSWIADRKHGFGRKFYPNGDYYEGFWRRNVQENQGRYVWRNGNEYVGEWKGGAINGRGVLIWANGNRYDGFWENGVPKGSGVFTWPDGSCYVGTWGKDPRSLNGIFYPSTRPQVLLPPPTLQKRSSVDGALVLGRGSASSKGLPRICIWESDGEAGDITCDIIDTLEASFLWQGRTHVDRVLGSSPASAATALEWRRSPCCFSMTGEAKKPGQTISKGHKDYDLMLNLQLGISYSVGRSASAEIRDLRAADFDPKEKFWTRFPTEGSKTTPPHQSLEFRWKDYCPMVFRHLRKLFNVDPADYMLAICGNDALRELSSPGKSGSFFYLTQDDRFMIKTVKKSEVKVLIRMLPSYYCHVSQYQNTLVTKFYGVHCVKPIGGPKVRFIVMGNLFCSEYRIHRRFDLKGSSYGRTTVKVESEIDETTTFKDLDLNFVFQLDKSWFQQLLWQIEMDCDFLELEGIMDYSLLVGIHFCDAASASQMEHSPSSASLISSMKSNSLVEAGDVQTPDSALKKLLHDSRKQSVRLGSNMPAKAVHVPRIDPDHHLASVGLLSPLFEPDQVHEVVLYFGIIDILQDYDMSKKLEHAYKSLQADPSSISAVDPKLYSRRFRDFIGAIFAQDQGKGDLG